MSSPSPVSRALETEPTTFPATLRALRRCLFGKQLALAAAIGCTEAAVSYWENGKRAPDRRKFPSIACALSEAGASRAELDQLRAQWETGQSRLAGTRSMREM